MYPSTNVEWMCGLVNLEKRLIFFIWKIHPEALSYYRPHRGLPSPPQNGSTSINMDQHGSKWINITYRGQVRWRAQGPDIRQTRECMRYYTQVARTNILACVTLERALIYCNFHIGGQARGLGPEGPKAPTLGRHVSACATILMLSVLL